MIMSTKIRIIGRRILNLKGLIYNDPVQLSVRSLASNLGTYSNSMSITRLMVPPASIDYTDKLVTKINAMQGEMPKSQILDRPLINSYIIDLPMIRSKVSYEDILPTTEIQDPNPSNVTEKHAVRMIVIRKRKMRIHKLKKLRKRMKSIWDKVKQRRRAEKEKLFQAELMAKIKETLKFDPAVYVKEKIAKSNEVLTPKLWRGKRLPEFIIKDLIEQRQKKREAIDARMERRRNMNLNPSDYK